MVREKTNMGRMKLTAGRSGPKRGKFLKDSDGYVEPKAGTSGPKQKGFGMGKEDHK